jgi:translation initiation factor 1 (eIF-1/SUI1)
MGKKKKRIDTSSDSQPLRSNAFADLADRLPKDLPRQSESPQQEAGKAEVIRSEKRPYSVARTKKGGYHLAFEKRAKGKGVTVLRGVSGDAGALLSELKKRCGAGGSVDGDAVEVQGDHRKAIEYCLRERGV